MEPAVPHQHLSGAGGRQTSLHDEAGSAAGLRQAAESTSGSADRPGEYSGVSGELERSCTRAGNASWRRERGADDDAQRRCRVERRQGPCRLIITLAQYQTLVHHVRRRWSRRSEPVRLERAIPPSAKTNQVLEQVDLLLRQEDVLSSRVLSASAAKCDAVSP